MVIYYPGRPEEDLEDTLPICVLCQDLCPGGPHLPGGPAVPGQREPEGAGAQPRAGHLLGPRHPHQHPHRPRTHPVGGAVHCGPRGCSRRYQLYEHLFCMFWASN